MQKLVGLENLPDAFGVKLEDNFRKALFNKGASMVGGVRKLALLLNCDRTAIWQWKTGKILTKIDLLKKLSKITKTDLEKIESKIIAIRSKRKRNEDFIKIKFPIFSSSELSLIIGKGMGDGSLSKKQFSYFNQSRFLINETIDNMKTIFSDDINPEEFEKDDGWEIEFPTNVGKLLSLAGAPLGEKVELDFVIPSWVRNGDLEIKSKFLRALFDDEAYVDVEGKTIVFGMSKKEELLDSLKKFLNGLRELLNEFKIETNPLRKPQLNESGTYQIYFSLKNYLQNIVNFREKIGFTDVEKSKKLLNIITKQINS